MCVVTVKCCDPNLPLHPGSGGSDKGPFFLLQFHNAASRRHGLSRNKRRALLCGITADSALAYVRKRFLCDSRSVFDLNQIIMPPKSINSFVTVIHDPAPG